MDRRRMPRAPIARFEDRTPDWSRDVDEAYQQRIPFKPGVLNYMAQGTTPGEYAMRKVLGRQLDLDMFFELMKYAQTPEVSPEEYFQNAYRTTPPSILRRTK